MDDVEVFPGRPVVPKVHECQFKACSVLEQDCMKLLGPNGGLRSSNDDSRARKRASEQQHRLRTHATGETDSAVTWLRLQEFRRSLNV